MKSLTHILAMLLSLSTQLSAEKIYATFDVKPVQEAHLAFSAGGIVQTVDAEISSIVTKGDTLAQLNNDDLRAKLDIAIIAMKHAKVEYERQLSIKRSVQKAKLDLYKFQYDNAKAQINYTQALLDKTVLKAPFDGIISSKMIEVGDVVSGMAPRTAFSLQSNHERKLVLAFDQKYWAKVRTGQTFLYTIDGDPKEYRGSIAKIYPKTNAQSRKMYAEVRTSNIMVGLFGTGHILVPEESN